MPILPKIKRGIFNFYNNLDTYHQRIFTNEILKYLQIKAFSIGIFLFFIGTQDINSQTLLKGVVRDQMDVTLPSATVELRTLSDSLVAYYITNQNGQYILNVHKIGNYKLKASFVGYKMYEVFVYVLSNANDTTEHNIILESNTTTLKEVEVVARRKAIIITNDSIIYNPSSFTQVQDKSLTQVLERLPGVKVKEGKIYVNNEPIDELLINGKNVSDNQTALTQSIDPVVVSGIKFKKIKDDIFGGSKNILDITLEENLNTNLFGKLDAGMSLNNDKILPDGFVNAFSLKKKLRVHFLETYDKIGLNNISDENLKLFDEETFEKRYDLQSSYSVDKFGAQGADLPRFAAHEKNSGGFATVFEPNNKLEIRSNLYHGFKKETGINAFIQDYIGVDRRNMEDQIETLDNKFLKAQFHSKYVWSDSTKATVKFFYKRSSTHRELNNKWSASNIDTLSFDYRDNQENNYWIPSFTFNHRWKKYGLDVASKGEWLRRGESQKTLKISEPIDYPLLKGIFAYDKIHLSQNQIVNALKLSSSATFSLFDSINVFRVGFAHYYSTNTILQGTFDAQHNKIYNDFFKNDKYILSYDVYAPFVSFNYRYKKIDVSMSLKRHYYDWHDVRFKTKIFNEWNSKIQYQYGMFRVITIKYELLPEIPTTFEIMDEYRLIYWNQYAIGSSQLNVVPAAVFSAAILHTIPQSGITLLGIYISGTSKNNDTYDFTQNPFYNIKQENQLRSNYEIFQVEPSLPIGGNLSLDFGYYYQKNNSENLIKDIGIYKFSLNRHEASMKLSSLFVKQVFNFNTSFNYLLEKYSTSLNQSNLTSQIIKYNINLRTAFFNKKVTLDLNWSKFLTLKGIANNVDNINFEIIWHPKKSNTSFGYSINNALNISKNRFYNYYEWGNSETSNSVFGMFQRLQVLMKLY